MTQAMGPTYRHNGPEETTKHMPGQQTIQKRPEGRPPERWGECG